MDSHDQAFHLISHSGNQKLVIHSRLLQVSMNMQHIDEMFTWLASLFVQRFDVQVMQFWIKQTSNKGEVSVALRTSVCQDLSFPQGVINNTYLTEAAAFLLNERRSVGLQSVDALFSFHQASLLKRYGLYYWLASFVSSDALLPPVGDAFSATPFAAIAMLFLRNPPSSNLLSFTISILDRAVIIAKNREFLLPPVALQSQELLVTLMGLIPRRLQGTGAMQLYSPFTRAPVNLEKKAMRLYSAIDNQKSVEELSYLTHLDRQAINEVIRTLLNQKYIQLFDAAGQPVDSSWLLDHL